MVENSVGFRKSKEKLWNIWSLPWTGDDGAVVRLMHSECAYSHSSHSQACSA